MYISIQSILWDKKTKLDMNIWKYQCYTSSRMIKQLQSGCLVLEREQSMGEEKLAEAEQK